jgi:hypothetical protein
MQIFKPKHKPKRPPLGIPKALIAAVDERDKRMCQRCGMKGTERHHIAYGAGMGRRRIHTIENLITLCQRCHFRAQTEREIREWCMCWSRERRGLVVDLIKAHGHRWREYL